MFGRIPNDQQPGCEEQCGDACLHHATVWTSCYAYRKNGATTGLTCWNRSKDGKASHQRKAGSVFYETYMSNVWQNDLADSLYRDAGWYLISHGVGKQGEEPSSKWQPGTENWAAGSAPIGSARILRRFYQDFTTVLSQWSPAYDTSCRCRMSLWTMPVKKPILDTIDPWMRKADFLHRYGSHGP